jgi:hypothetical protein
VLEARDMLNVDSDAVAVPRPRGAVHQVAS